MVSWWVRNSCFNNEKIQISNIVLMNAACSLSGFFGSRYGSKCIGHNIYIGRSINIRYFSGVSTILIGNEFCRQVS